MYGCSYNESKDHRTIWKNLMIKIVPLLLSEKNKVFSFKKCKFRVEKAKEAAARVVVFREFNLLHSYTMETSFFGPLYKAHLENREPELNETQGDAQMGIEDYKRIGTDFSKVLLQLID